MKKVKLKQGTLAWEKARETRIGSSEVFDIIKYYATDEELQNCGINSEAFRAEKPYTTVWALYHKMLGDGFYKKEELAPEFAEYGHAVEPYGVRELQKERQKKLRPGEVYADDRLIASIDICGTAEECDANRAFDYGNGKPLVGQSFVCEQKSMLPSVVKNGLPYKYIIQAQYQITKTGKDFFILQLMILKEDSPFIRGRVVQMSRKKRYEYLDGNLLIKNYYFRNNEHLAQLIETCLERFFADVDALKEPKPFILYDSQRNIIESLRINALFNEDMTIDYQLDKYIRLKDAEDTAIYNRKMELQKITERAMESCGCRFKAPDGTTGFFSKDGKFLIRNPKEAAT